jgi:hypothetical protein
MWVRTEHTELINLQHAHNVHMVEHGAPRFQIEVIAVIGSERHVLAQMAKTGPDGRKMAVGYINALCAALQQSGHIYSMPMMSRHNDLTC